MSVRRVLCAFLALCCLHSQVRAQQCGYTTNTGFTFDFSNLKKTSTNSDYVTPLDTAGYTYHFNLCAASTSTDAKCYGTTRQGSVCQYNNAAPPTVAAICAYWPGTTVGVWALTNAADPTKGVTFTVKNGDACYPFTTPRTTVFNFVCDQNTIGAIAGTESSSCAYTITVPTSYACYNSPPPTTTTTTTTTAATTTTGGSTSNNNSDNGGGDDKLSGGWIFVIIVLCPIPVYIAAGCAWNHHKHGDTITWMQKCPQKDFWFGLPILCWDGCKYTWSKIRALIARCTGGSSSEGSASSESYEGLK